MYKELKVEEIRELLRKEPYNITDEEFLKQRKRALVEFLEENSKQDIELEDALNKAEEDIDIIVNTPQKDIIENENMEPAYNSPKWNDFLLSQLRDNELVDGNPKHYGLRRLVEEYIGPIISQKIGSYTSPSKDNGGNATVVTSFVILVQNETHPSHNDYIEIESIGGCNCGNTDSPYSRYTESMAETRSESRAFRKILRLDAVSAEEISNVANESSNSWELNEETITDSQCSVIDMLCKRLNINVVKFLNSGKQEYLHIKQISKNTAGKMLAEINVFQQDKKPIPEHLQGYEENWQEKMNN